MTDVHEASDMMRAAKGTLCHSREGGNPVAFCTFLDPRLRGGDIRMVILSGDDGVENSI